MSRPDRDERSDSADKLANKLDELLSSVTTDGGPSEAEDPESDNFDHHAGLSNSLRSGYTHVTGCRPVSAVKKPVAIPKK